MFKQKLKYILEWWKGERKEERKEGRSEEGKKSRKQPFNAKPKICKMPWTMHTKSSMWDAQLKLYLGVSIFKCDKFSKSIVLLHWKLLKGFRKYVNYSEFSKLTFI
jgi:hypothetical protein